MSFLTLVMGLTPPRGGGSGTLLPDFIRMCSRNHLLLPSGWFGRPPVRALSRPLSVKSAFIRPSLALVSQRSPLAFPVCLVLSLLERTGGEDPLDWAICLGTVSRRHGGAADAKGRDGGKLFKRVAKQTYCRGMRSSSHP